MVSDVLIAGLAAGLAILALAVLYIGVLAVKLNRPEQERQPPDPHVERLAGLIDAIVERRRETHERLETLRATVARGLRGHEE